MCVYACVRCVRACGELFNALLLVLNHLARGEEVSRKEEWRLWRGSKDLGNNHSLSLGPTGCQRPFLAAAKGRKQGERAVNDLTDLRLVPLCSFADCSLLSFTASTAFLVVYFSFF